MKYIKKIGYSCLLLLWGLPVHRAFSQDNQIKKIQNLNAAGGITYFNLEKGIAVGEADTAQTGWDIAFQNTAIILQTAAGGQIVANTSFDKVTGAPAGGYKKGRQAIPPGSGNGWYTYNMENHIISPIPGRVILIHTATGKHYKLIIDSYYKDGPDGAAGNYTFQYAGIDPEK